VGDVSMSICEKTTTLILDLQLAHHFIHGAGIGSSTAATDRDCTRSRSVLLSLLY
jgi:hypothetical protein